MQVCPVCLSLLALFRLPRLIRLGVSCVFRIELVVSIVFVVMVYGMRLVEFGD